MRRIVDLYGYVAGFAILFVPTALAIFASAKLSKRSVEEWQLLAWVPSIPLIGFWIYLFTARNVSNLWPFAMMFVVLVSALLFAVFLVARKVSGSSSRLSRWRH